MKLWRYVWLAAVLAALMAQGAEAIPIKDPCTTCLQIWPWWMCVGC